MKMVEVKISHGLKRVDICLYLKSGQGIYIVVAIDSLLPSMEWTFFRAQAKQNYARNS